MQFHTTVREIKITVIVVPPSPPLPPPPFFSPPPPFPSPLPPPLSSSSSSLHAGGLSRSRISEESGRPAMAAGSTAPPKQDGKPPQLEQDACAPAVVCEPRTDEGPTKRSGQLVNSRAGTRHCHHGPLPCTGRICPRLWYQS